MTALAGRTERFATDLVCSRSGARGALDEPQFLSPAGAPWLVEYDLAPELGERWRRELPSREWTLWRYRELLPIADFDGRVSLGEGGTPLLPLAGFVAPGVRLMVKEEGGNPTGSFKARGLSLAVNRARELGAPGVQLTSAGNAAVALSAYAAAASLPCRVALPDDTPEIVFRRCREHGSKIVHGPGTLVEVAAELGAFDDGYWNLSTLREPYRIEGKKTMGFELWEQLGGRLPDWIVYPTGGGTGLIGMLKAFDELEAMGLVDGRRPRMVAVQMSGCAPIVRAFEDGAKSAEAWREPRTEVWGLRVPQALGDFLILDGLYRTDGRAVAIEEELLGEITARAARETGLLFGPEGAAALAATERVPEIRPGEVVVVFQTGHPQNYG